MNERIRELLKQATKEVDPYDRVWVFSKVDQAKFAELIVKECAMLVKGFEITQEVALDEYVDYEASAVLKEHFGIEE
jgi:hypothetical protein